MSATIGQKAVVRGAAFAWTFTLDGAGSIAGATVTANLRKRGSTQVLIAAHALTIADHTLRTVTLALSESETPSLIGDPNDPLVEVSHVADVTMVLGGTTSVFGPLLFPVRTGA